MVKLVSAAVPGRSLARLYGLMGLMNFLFLVLTLPLPSILTLYWPKGRTSTMILDHHNSVPVKGGKCLGVFTEQLLLPGVPLG